MGLSLELDWEALYYYRMVPQSICAPRPGHTCSYKHMTQTHTTSRCLQRMPNGISKSCTITGTVTGTAAAAAGAADVVATVTVKYLISFQQ